MSDSATSDLYWQTISDRAAVESFDESDPFRDPLSSIESSIASNGAMDVFSYAREKPDSFLALLDDLIQEKREIAIEYFLLRKTEQQIAVIHGRHSQSMVGVEIFSIVQSIGARLLLGKTLTTSRLEKILRESRVSSPQYAAPLFERILRNGAGWSDKDTYCRMVATDLLSSKFREGRALAVLVFNAITRRTEIRTQSVHIRRARSNFKEPCSLGNFELDMLDQNSIFFFTERAGQVSNASQAERKTS